MGLSSKNVCPVAMIERVKEGIPWDNMLGCSAGCHNGRKLGAKHMNFFDLCG